MTLLNRTQRTLFTTLVLSGCSLAVLAQTATTPAPPAAAPAASEPAAPHSTVLFERHADPDAAPAAKPALPPAVPATTEGDEKLAGAALSDEERSALTITAYDLDARLVPASAQMEMRARLTLHNDGATPLSRVALQISSTLNWQSVTLLDATSQDATRTRLNVVQHLVDTDADHTGRANEVVLELPAPLAAGATLSLDTLYSGTIVADAGRLERIGANHEQAAAADWDAITATATALRGFGNVLWYPVASPQLFLGDGAKLFQAIAANRLREEAASVRLRVALEYKGDPPVAVYFCGLRRPLVAVSDNSDAPVASSSGIATADFPAATLGFRPLSLFVVEQPEALVAPLGTAKDAEKLLAVETSDEAALPRLADSAESLAPLLQQWLGVHTASALTLIDHDGQPFEDGPLLVAPMAALSGTNAAPALLQSLTHAWVQSGQPWMDEGLPAFLTLLYTEQQQGREAANAALKDLLRPLALAEPPPDALSTGSAAGQPLIAASDELYYRRKAAAAWWALRSVTGDQALQVALTTWLSQPVSKATAINQATALEQATAFERIVEQASHKDLAWFFNDWVYRDRGLPDLTIAAVEPRLLEAGKGHDTGWLVAVTVRNEGAAAAQVPLIVRAGDLSVTRTIHVAGLSSTVERVVIEAKPTQILLNGGAMPELREFQHTTNVTVRER